MRFEREGLDPYLTTDSDCMRNRLGIFDAETLRQAEYLIVARNTPTAISKAQKKRRAGASLDMELWQSIHRDLFGSIYDWAGETRTVNIAKGETVFLPVDRIGLGSAYAFKELAKDNNLKGLPKEAFCARAAHHFAEFNHIHPFREDNGRAQRALFDVIAGEAGYMFDWNRLERSSFIDAVIRAENGDSKPLAGLFEEIVESTSVKKRVTQKSQKSRKTDTSLSL